MQECSAGGEFDDRREYFKYGSKEINCLAPPSVNKKYKSNILLLFTENKQKNFPLSIHFIWHKNWNIDLRCGEQKKMPRIDNLLEVEVKEWIVLKFSQCFSCAM